MSNREIFIANQIKIDESNTEVNKLQDISFALEEVNVALIPKIIEEEQLLKGSRWELIAGSGKHSSSYLQYIGSVKDDAMKPIMDLTWNGYHSSFTFEDGIEMYFDDNRISMRFKDARQILDFYKKMNIVIDVTPVKISLQKLKKDMLDLEMIFHQLQLVV